MPDAEIGGVSIRFRDEGPRDGLPVVLIHGFPFSHAMWERQIAALMGEFRAIAYDVRGLGGSGGAGGPCTMELFVDDLAGLLDRLGIERAVLCGLSMGGYIALRAAQREPARVRALVLADTRSEADTDQARFNRAAAVKAVEEDGLEPFAEDFLKKVFAPSFLADAGKRAAVGRIKGLITSQDPRGVCAALMAMAGRADTTPGLPGVKAPSLVLVGESDVLTPPAAARALAGAIPGAQLHVIPQAGHMSSMENPEEFNRLLLGFLRRISG